MELNPENELLTSLRGNDSWMKLCGLLLQKFSPDKPVDIGMEDITVATKGEPLAVTVMIVNNGTPQESIRLQMVSMGEANRLAQRERGNRN